MYRFRLDLGMDGNPSSPISDLLIVRLVPVSVSVAFLIIQALASLATNTRNKSVKKLMVFIPLLVTNQWLSASKIILMNIYMKCSWYKERQKIYILIIGYLKSVCKIPASTSYRWIVRFWMSVRSSSVSRSYPDGDLSSRPLLPLAFILCCWNSGGKRKVLWLATGHLNTRMRPAHCYTLYSIVLIAVVNFFFLYIYI